MAAAALLAPGLSRFVVAEEGAPASDGIVPPPAGQDLDTLRRLLGLPSAPAAPAVEAAPAAAEPAPAAAAPTETPKAKPAVARPKPAPKPKAPPKKVVRPAPKPAAKKPAEEAARPAEPAADAPAKDESAGAEETTGEAVEETAGDEEGAAAIGSADDVPPPGTVVTAANLERWKHVLGPSIQWAVSRGATLPVIEATPAPLEPFREEATRRYSPQVTLSPDKNAMRNYVAGIPFPLVTDSDPDVAIKMMFNFESRLAIDDVTLRNFSCDTGRTDPRLGLQIERHYVVDAFRRLFYVSRFHIDPKPTWPTPDGVRYREALGPLHEPFDLKGAGFAYIRFLDPGHHDDSWLYFPQFKRVRRLSTAQRSEGVFGQDVDLDSYAGYAGNPAWSHWTYLGKKTVLGSMHARNLPAKYQDAPADFFPDDVWEPREVYILLAVSKLGGYNFGQRVLYLDRESLFIPYTEIYDLKGALWKGLVQTWKHGPKPREEATRSVYSYDQFYIPTLSMFDIQSNHATRCLLPSPDEKGEEGWYFNFGDEEGTTEEVFSVSHFIQIGR